MYKTFLLSLAASYGVQSAPMQTTTSSSLQIANVTNSANEMSTHSATTSSLSNSSIPSPFLTKLLSQTQDLTSDPRSPIKPETLLLHNEMLQFAQEYIENYGPDEEMKSWVDEIPREWKLYLTSINEYNNDIFSSFHFSDTELLHLAGVSEVLKPIIEEVRSTQSKLVQDTREKMGRYAFCENLRSEEKMTVRVIFVLHGQNIERSVHCAPGTSSIIKIPANAENVQYLQKLGEGAFEAMKNIHDSHHVRTAEGWRTSTFYSMKELAAFEREQLDKLIISDNPGDTIKYAMDLMKAFGKNDKTGLYQHAKSTWIAAKQAKNEQETAKQWFKITEEAKKRAKLKFKTEL